MSKTPNDPGVCKERKREMKRKRKRKLTGFEANVSNELLRFVLISGFTYVTRSGTQQETEARAAGSGQGPGVSRYACHSHGD